MSALNDIYSYPEISFIGDISLDRLMGEMVQDFQEKYKEITGKNMTLGKADPNRLILYAAALQIFQGFVNIDKAAKSNFLKYTSGDALEELCSLKGIQRMQGSSASTIIKFTLAAEQISVISIPMGTRVTGSGDVCFYTTESASIGIGELEVEVPAICVETGEQANGIEIGELNVLVDAVPYVDSVMNTMKTEGGAGIESDERLKERFFLAPSSYSVAGPDGAYEYWTKSYNPSIKDVRVTSPEPCVVNIRFIMNDGRIPGNVVIQGLREYLMNENIRPLTDQVVVEAPELEPYNVKVRYFIKRSDTSKEMAIKAQVDQAVNNYNVWQQEKIGRDITPDVLIQYMMAAGAKRVIVEEPVYRVIEDISIAQLSEETVTYGGIEDD